MIDMDKIKESYGKCVLEEGFFDKFYFTFFNSHADFKPLFSKTDFNKQKQLLKETINFMIMYANGSGIAARTLDRVAILHDKDHINIRPEYYKYWVDSLIDTLKEFDKEFDDSLEHNWRETLDQGIQLFISRYEPKSEGDASEETE